MNFISRNYLRAIPLLVAVITWVVGYIYIYKLVEFGLCSVDSYTCSPLLSDIGHPMSEFSKWFFPTAIMMLFVPITFLKRWIIFLIPYLLITAYFVNTESRDSLVGKENIAMFFGIAMLVITLVWLVVHLFFARRNRKSVSF